MLAWCFVLFKINLRQTIQKPNCLWRWGHGKYRLLFPPYISLQVKKCNTSGSTLTCKYWTLTYTSQKGKTRHICSKKCRILLKQWELPNEELSNEKWGMTTKPNNRNNNNRHNPGSNARMIWVEREWPMNKTAPHANTTCNWEVSTHHRTSSNNMLLWDYDEYIKLWVQSTKPLHARNLSQGTYIHRTRNMFHRGKHNECRKAELTSPHVRGLRRTKGNDATTSADKL